MKIFAHHVIIDAAQPAQPALITVDGRDITRVDRDDPEPRDADVVFEDRYAVVPAFINTHAHLALSALRGLGGLSALRGNVVEDLYFRVEQELCAEDVFAFAQIGAVESLLTGTGIVWDHYYFGDAVARACEAVGLCAVVAPTLQDLGGPGIRWLDQQLAETEAIHHARRLQRAGIVAALGPHATDTVSDELWRAVHALAQAWQAPVHAHLAQSPDELRRSMARHGCPPLTRLRRLGTLDLSVAAVLAHGLYVRDDELVPLAQESAVLAYTPAAQAQFDFPAPAARWAAAGGTVALGTDAGSCNDSLDIQGDLRLAAVGPAFALTEHPDRITMAADLSAGAVQRFVARRQTQFDQKPSLSRLLAMVWDAPGALHPHLPAGRIAAGCLANLAVYDRHHPAMWPGLDVKQALAFGRCAGALHAMMTAGRWQGTIGDLQRSVLARTDVQDAVAEANKRLKALLAKIGE
ncbi:MAG: amidohydrolase family protein [Myxococcota bacterium]